MMNIIEKLGGYERAKSIANCKSGIVHPTQQLLDALLEYRREHNIFEVGDLIIDKDHTGLLRVTRVMKKRFEVDYLNPNAMNVICHSSILMRHVAHANDAEIKAGRRL